MPMDGKQRSVAELKRLAKRLRAEKAPPHVRRFAHCELVTTMLCAGQLSDALQLALAWDFEMLTETDGGILRRVLDDLETIGHDTAELRALLLREGDDEDQQREHG